MSLNLPEQELSLGEQEALGIRQQWTTEGYVAAQLQSWGFEPLPKPAYAPPAISPEQLASLDNTAYTDVYARIVAWVNYAESNLGQIKSAILSRKNLIPRLQAEVIKAALERARKNKEKKPPKDELENLCNTHPQIQAVKLEMQILQQQELNQSAHFEGLQRTASMISRSIEIRRLEWEAHRVGGNINNRPGHPRGPY